MSNNYSEPPLGPYAPLPAPPAQRGGLGKAGLILGIIAVALAFIPGLLYVGFVLGILALVFGIIALRRGTGRGLPATILGGASILLASLFGAIYGGGASTTPSVAVDTPAAAHATKAAPTKVSAPDVVGMTVSAAEKELESQDLLFDANGADDDQTVTAQDPAASSEIAPGTVVSLTAQPPLGSSVAAPAPAGNKFDMESTNRIDGTKADYQEWVDSYNDNFVSSNEFEQPDAGKKYVVVTVHVVATTAGVDASTVAYDLALSDASGNVYDSTTLVEGLTEMPSVTLGAGQTAQGQVAFEVPDSFHGGVASFGDGTIFEKTN
ncbi:MULTISPECIES: PASTA domain-containing protein [unclassified Curtobacterium]|uniref:PASTA domain-containing protein n=1 Tax=unclassified Curtobacterium TaxID=257496 RepID=UPI000DA83221|nr:MULTISPECIES: PASTA domain-containing protein [unclassified Curtobacterium]WIB64610.1 PASTA domain-containing protein [Curtobacterium sp. MCBD17_040]WIB68453.1 PASTA domain-containing protein [Curtobacterium sp. MCBD17_035]